MYSELEKIEALKKAYDRFIEINTKISSEVESSGMNDDATIVVQYYEEFKKCILDGKTAYDDNKENIDSAIEKVMHILNSVNLKPHGLVIAAFNSSIDAINASESTRMALATCFVYVHAVVRSIEKYLNED